MVFDWTVGLFARVYINLPKVGASLTILQLRETMAWRSAIYKVGVGLDHLENQQDWPH